VLGAVGEALDVGPRDHSGALPLDVLPQGLDALTRVLLGKDPDRWRARAAVCLLNPTWDDAPRPDTEDAGTEPLGCDFAMHEPEAPHTVCAQMQYTAAADLVLWWLLWDEDGYRELRIAPGCRKIVVDETSLLIEGHPQDCDEDWGWTREELRIALEATE
jgi:hypothetical protein